ncbi:gos-28, partial [Pristionchus pacificus]|uniref:Golgi SNAP receptor complex member 1 n=1 Tax=Pristionchus pacificus TaxID=54126 RepID=A0A8R1V2T4_PRIPA
TNSPTPQQFAAAATMAQRWEELRKRARTLENDVDVKLAQLNKMTGNGRSVLSSPSSTSSSSSTDRQQLFTGMCDGLERVIGQLQECNDEMCSLVEGSSGAGWAANPAVTHTVRRHRDILRDYGSEYKRARENIQAQLQREFLLAGASPSSPDGSCLNNRVRASDMYYREQDHISSCDRLIDDQIAIAVSTKENLSKQGMNLKGISRRMHDLAQKYPAIGSIMSKIQNKKRKDAIIMAAVVSTCLIFTLFYLMH